MTVLNLYLVLAPVLSEETDNVVGPHGLLDSRGLEIMSATVTVSAAKNGS
jgi:hypothetical protein